MCTYINIVNPNVGLGGNACSYCSPMSWDIVCLKEKNDTNNNNDNDKEAINANRMLRVDNV